MPTPLENAYAVCKNTLTEQVQGTCGLYSFWYASVMLLTLEKMETDKRLGVPTTAAPTKVDFLPRKHPNAMPHINWAVDTRATESLRSYAKKGLSSGQGEILSADEMGRLINHFGYNYRLPLQGQAKKGFISEFLSHNRPVIFAYTMSDNGPTKALPNDVRGDDIGSHFSLIIAETADKYRCINPWYPDQLKEYSKTGVLESNANVDNHIYPRFWGKRFAGDLTPFGNNRVEALKQALKGGGVESFYDIGQGGRKQNLKDVLVAVWK